MVALKNFVNNMQSETVLILDYAEHTNTSFADPHAVDVCQSIEIIFFRPWQRQWWILTENSGAALMASPQGKTRLPAIPVTELRKWSFFRTHQLNMTFHVCANLFRCRSIGTQQPLCAHKNCLRKQRTWKSEKQSGFRKRHKVRRRFGINR